MSIEISIVFPGCARVGEGPFWDGTSGRLHWVDILAGEIHTGDPASGRRETIRLPTLVGAAVPKNSGGFVAATAEGFAAMGADGTMTREVAVLPDGIRMNDAKCDPAGRLWSGSTEMGFAAGQGALHVLSADPGAGDWRSEQVLDGLTLPNGLGWSPDGRSFYLVDTMARELTVFDVVPDLPGLAQRRLLMEFPEGTGLPDGLAIDADGCLWVAMWGGSRVVRISPEGRTLQEVALPVAQPTSCAFGGPDLDTLYVTSAREGLDLAADDPSGSVFAVRGLGVRGLPAVEFRDR